MTAEARMKVYRAAGELLDQVERLRRLDPDAARYVIRAVNCLRAQLGAPPIVDVDELSGAAVHVENGRPTPNREIAGSSPVRPASFLLRMLDDQRRGAAAVDGVTFP